MPTLVHIADEKNAARIKRVGIVPGKKFRAVYFMPVVRDHFISHQWLRELKRSGAKTLVGVYFRLPSEELVWAGRYAREHRQIYVGEAIRELDSLADPLGYEIYIERKITANEISRIRHLPQKIGWRYMPNAHGKAPCPCPACLRRGEYGAAKIRAKYDPPEPPTPYAELLRTIATSDDPGVLADCLWPLRNKRRKTDPVFLARLMEIQDEYLLEELALTLPYFNHINSKPMLIALSESNFDDLRNAALEGLEEIGVPQTMQSGN